MRRSARSSVYLSSLAGRLDRLHRRIETRARARSTPSCCAARAAAPGARGLRAARPGLALLLSPRPTTLVVGAGGRRAPVPRRERADPHPRRRVRRPGGRRGDRGGEPDARWPSSCSTSSPWPAAGSSWPAGSTTTWCAAASRPAPPGGSSRWFRLAGHTPLPATDRLRRHAAGGPRGSVMSPGYVVGRSPLTAGRAPGSLTHVRARRSTIALSDRPRAPRRSSLTACSAPSPAAPRRSRPRRAATPTTSQPRPPRATPTDGMPADASPLSGPRRRRRQAGPHREVRQHPERPAARRPEAGRRGLRRGGRVRAHPARGRVLLGSAERSWARCAAPGSPTSTCSPVRHAGVRLLRRPDDAASPFSPRPTHRRQRRRARTATSATGSGARPTTSSGRPEKLITRAKAGVRRAEHRVRVLRRRPPRAAGRS